MNMRYVMAGGLLALGFFGMAPGCSSAQTVCELACECQHCSDPTEDVTCYAYKVQEAEAQAYACDDAWEALMTCVQEKGTCNEKEAQFSTRANGTCSDTQMVGGNCMTNADCQQIGIPGKTACTNGMCVVYRCSGGGQSCDTDADCAGNGEELCDKEKTDVADCIDKASGGAPPKGF